MSKKQFKRWFLLVLATAFASLFILIFKQTIFQDYYALMGIRIKRELLSEWLNQVFFISNLVGYATGVILLLFWIFSASRYRASKAADVIPKRITWLVLFWGYIFFNILTFFLLSFFYEAINNTGLLIYYPISVVLDAVLLFWLPSALGTPGTLRNIPPLARPIRNLYGG